MKTLFGKYWLLVIVVAWPTRILIILVVQLLAQWLNPDATRHNAEDLMLGSLYMLYISSPLVFIYTALLSGLETLVWLAGTRWKVWKLNQFMLRLAVLLSVSTAPYLAIPDIPFWVLILVITAPDGVVIWILDRSRNEPVRVL